MRGTSTKPKRQPCRIIQQTIDRTGVKQQGSYQFASNCLQVYELTHSFGQSQQHNSPLPDRGRYGLLSHLVYQDKIGKQIKKQFQQKMVTASDSSFKQQSHIVKDQDGQFMSYMKQYETVIKNSRRRDVIQPRIQEKEMEGLIDEFLSDIKGNKSNNKIGKKTKEHQPVQIDIQLPSSTKAPVRIQRIDLDTFKSNKKGNTKDRNQHLKSTTATKKQKIVHPVEVREYNEEFSLSPRFGTSQKRRIQSRSPIRRVKGEQQKQKMQVKVVKVVKVDENKILKPRQKPILKKIQPFEMKPKLQGYSNTIKQHQSSYLKQNFHKTKGTLDLCKEINNQKHYKNATNLTNPKTKPITIQINIPLEELSDEDSGRIQNYRVESKTVNLQGQETHIIREVTQRVLSLLQKTKQQGQSSSP